MEEVQTSQNSPEVEMRFSGKRKLGNESSDERIVKKFHSEQLLDEIQPKKHKKKKKHRELPVEVSNADGVIEPEDGAKIRKSNKKKKKSKDKLRETSESRDNLVEVEADGSENLPEVTNVHQEHSHVKHKKKKKSKDKIRYESHSELPIDDVNAVAVKGKHKKEKKSKDKDKSNNGVGISNSDQAVVNDTKAEVSGFIVDALSEVFDNKPRKKKKKKKSKKEERPFDQLFDIADATGGEEVVSVLQVYEDHLDSVDLSQSEITSNQTFTDTLNISKLLDNNSVSAVLDNTERLIDKIDANRALSSTPNKGKKRKLKNKTDLNLLNDPEESQVETLHQKETEVYNMSSINLDDSIAASLDISLPIEDCLLPLTQESSMSMSLDCSMPLHQDCQDCSQDYNMSMADEGNVDIPSASSVSWHVPEARVVVQTSPQKSFIKNLVKNAVNQVLIQNDDNTEQAVDPLDQKYSHQAATDRKSGHRRSLVNYEELCKTFLDDPALALQQSVGSSGEDGCGGSKKKKKDKKTSSTAQKDDSTPYATLTQNKSTNNNAVNKNWSPYTPVLSWDQSQSSYVKKTITIKDMYRLPSRKKVPLVLFQTCQFIMSQAVPVSRLNIVYTGHSVPREKDYRKDLRRKYGAKFGNYYEEQDLIIMRRFDSLVESGVVGDKVEFCNFLNKYCSGKDQRELNRSRRSIGVRNIVGLFIGQDIPYKIAAVHCLRLIKLVLGASNIFRAKKEVLEVTENMKSQPLDEETGQDDVEPNDQENTPPTPSGQEKTSKSVKTPHKCVQKWTMDEDQTLVDLVIGFDGGTKVEEVDTMMIDWEGISEEFPGRSQQNIKEHWLRVVHPALVEDIEPDAILDYRRRLLEEVMTMGAGHRKDINWGNLSKKFYPRSSASIQVNFSDLIKGGYMSKSIDSSEEFHRRVADALAKVERMSQLPETELTKFFKRNHYKSELRDYYVARIIDQTSASATTDCESEDSK